MLSHSFQRVCLLVYTKLLSNIIEGSLRRRIVGEILPNYKWEKPSLSRATYIIWGGGAFEVLPTYVPHSAAP